MAAWVIKTTGLPTGYVPPSAALIPPNQTEATMTPEQIYELRVSIQGVLDDELHDIDPTVALVERWITEVRADEGRNTAERIAERLDATKYPYAIPVGEAARIAREAGGGQ